VSQAHAARRHHVHRAVRDPRTLLQLQPHTQIQ
jgi:hypothetical protein